MTLFTDAGRSGYYNVPAKNNTDFANVPLEWTFSPDDFTTTNATIVCGESIDTSSLITKNQIILPTGADAWKADYVKAVLASGSTESPTKTTSYRFVQQVAPKVETAQKATVTDSVSPQESVCYSTVTVQYTVTDRMTNLTYDGPTLITCGEDINGKITASDGYLLPDSITISVGGAVLSASAYIYDKQTGDLAIAAEQLQSGNIVISGDAAIPDNPVYVFEFSLIQRSSVEGVDNVSLYYSDDNSNYTLASDTYTTQRVGGTEQKFLANKSVGKHRYWKIQGTGYGTNGGMVELEFYGME